MGFDFERYAEEQFTHQLVLRYGRALDITPMELGAANGFELRRLQEQGCAPEEWQKAFSEWQAKVARFAAWRIQRERWHSGEDSRPLVTLSSADTEGLKNWLVEELEPIEGIALHP